MDPILKAFLVVALTLLSIITPLVSMVIALNIGRVMNNKRHHPNPLKVAAVVSVGTVITLAAVYLAIWTFHQ